MRFILPAALVAFVALLGYMAFYAVVNIADGNPSYIGVLVAELIAARALATWATRLLRRR